MLCFSEYSLASIRTIASGSSNMYEASVLLISVLPVPDGPQNRKLAIGRLWFDRPLRERRIACATAFTASSWPTTSRCRIFSRRSSLTRSLSIILVTGMPVQRLTIEAMFSLVTVLAKFVLPSASSLRACSCSLSARFSRSGMA